MQRAYSDSDLYGRLRAFYASDLTSEEKIERWTAILEEAGQQLPDAVACLQDAAK